MKQESFGILLVFVASCCFGTLAIFGKYAEASGLDTITLLTYRFSLGTVILWAGLALWGRARLLTGRALRIAVILGVLYAVFSTLFFWGILFIPAGVAGITFYTFPVIVYILALKFLNETMTARKVIALIVASIGVVFIITGDETQINLLGVFLVFLAACGYAIYITGSRVALASIAPDLLAGTALIATAATFLIGGTFSGQLSVPTGTEQWLIIGGIAVLGTALPLLLYVTGLQRIEASHAAIISTAEPLMTVLLGVILLNEGVTVTIILGGGLVIAAVVVIQTDAAAEARTVY